MGNETHNPRIDLIDLDIEEMKINRELYNLQLQINSKLPNDKKVKIKSNYKQIAERKIYYLEQKKLKLLNSEKEKEKSNENKKIDNIVETGENEEQKNNIQDNKLSLISNSSNRNKKNLKGMLINKIEEKINENNSNNKEIISDSENGKIKTIYTKKAIKKMNKVNINELNNNDNINKNDDEDIKDNKKEDRQNNNDNNLEENLNINEYKRKFFDKLSSIGRISNINKSMDNKNSSDVEELEVVGLSQNDILKDKLSEFFVGTSVASSSNNNKNNSSMYNNCGKNRPKSEISGINQQLISASKSGNEDNENNENNNSYNSQNNINSNYEENQEFTDRNNENENGYGTGVTGEKYDTEETINKEMGNSKNEKLKEKNGNNGINERRKLLKNNRNKSYFVLEDTSRFDNDSAKESQNRE